MTPPDEYWAKIAEAAEMNRNIAAAQSASVKVAWVHQSVGMAGLSRRKYAGRVRSDGKVLCLKCRKYRDPKYFWIIAGGTYLWSCKGCSSKQNGSHEKAER